MEYHRQYLFSAWNRPLRTVGSQQGENGTEASRESGLEEGRGAAAEEEDEEEEEGAVAGADSGDEDDDDVGNKKASGSMCVWSWIRNPRFLSTDGACFSRLEHGFPIS